MEEGVQFRDILLKKEHHYWRNMLIALIVALSLAGFWYLVTKVKIELPQVQGTTTTIKEDVLIEDDYIQGRIDNYIENNPSTNEIYARDIVYLNIAREEKNASLCEKISSSELKLICSDAVR